MQKKKLTSKKRGKFVPGDFLFKVKRTRAGLGLITLSEIPRGACVIEYKGNILTKKQEDESNSLYLFDAGGGVTLDGSPKWNTARWINHSCRPNCEIEIYKHRVYVMAKRKIKAGEELNYDYDSDYFDAYIKPKGCKCVKCSPQLYAPSKPKAGAR